MTRLLASAACSSAVPQCIYFILLSIYTQAFMYVHLYPVHIPMPLCMSIYIHAFVHVSMPCRFG